MDLYASTRAVAIRYPVAGGDSANLAVELAARLDELTAGATLTFSDQVLPGLPAADESAIYVGLASEWAAAIGRATPPGWSDDMDISVRVARRAHQFKPGAAAREFHLMARDGPLLLRAAWLLLHALGWRHFMPCGVAGLENVWLVKKPQETLSVHGERTWIGAVDHAVGTIAGGTTNLNFSDGTDHETVEDPDGLLEGDLKGAIGDRPLIAAAPAPTWLRHMGWTMSSNLQVNEAWIGITKFDTTLSAWDEATQTGHYTASGHKLYTDHAAVQAAALAYAIDKATDTFKANGLPLHVALDWVSVARSDGDTYWDEDFGDAAFGAKPPVQRQIELANHVAQAGSADMAGVVIQAYGLCAETPVAAMPDPARVCVVVVEGYRPPGKTVEAVVADYVDAQGLALCPLGLYQYLHSSAWGPGGLTANAGSPSAIVDAANRVRALPACRPKVICGEAMTEFGAYGLGYYCYMRMVLDVGRAAAPFTQVDFDKHAGHFYTDLFPTAAVREAMQDWYAALLDTAHKPLLSSHLLHRLWVNLEVAMAACNDGSDEELRLVEFAKFTRYLDLRNVLEATQAIEDVGDPASRLLTVAAYDAMLALVFRIRDSGLVDADALFDNPLDDAAHADLGLGTVYTPLNEPPGAGRGGDEVGNGPLPAWDTSVPVTAEVSGWIAEGSVNNQPHGLDDLAYGSELTWDATLVDSRTRQTAAAIRPYRSKGKTRAWLVSGAAVFTCTYTVGPEDGGAFVEFVNQMTQQVDASVTVDPALGVRSLTQSVALTQGQLYEMRLTNYATGDRLWLDWWTPSSDRHGVCFDPGRDGDIGGFHQPLKRSYYFQVPDGITEIHFYAENTDEMALYLSDGAGGEVQDLAFAPQPRSFQRHAVAGSGRRVLRIAGVHINQIGFWLLNCPNLFAWHPEELLTPPGV